MTDNSKLPTAEPKGRRSLFRTGCLGLLALGGFGAVVGNLANLSANRAAAALGPDLDPLELQCDDAWAGRIRTKAERSGLIRGQQLDSTKLVLLVRPSVWYSVSQTSAEALALAEACRVDRGFALLTVSFRLSLDGENLMRMTPYDLYALAQGQFVAEPAAPAPTGVGDLKWGSRRPSNLKPVMESESLYVPKRAGAYLGIAARDQDYEFDGGRLRGGHFYLDGPDAFKSLKARMKSAYGSPSWRELDQVSQGYGWEWKDRGVSVEARFDLTKETTTVTLQRSNPSERTKRRE